MNKRTGMNRLEKYLDDKQIEFIPNPTGGGIKIISDVESPICDKIMKIIREEKLEMLFYKNQILIREK